MTLRLFIYLGNGYNPGGLGIWSGVICLYGAGIWDPLYGACCFGPGDCWETDDQDCDLSGGSFYENESCDEACPTYYGACCFSPGDCYETEEWDCMDSGGDFYQDEYCEDVCAEEPTIYGACCLANLDCYQGEEYECADAGGDFYQDAECVDVCYDPAYGGCCIGFAGDCQVLTENECYAKNGDYLGDDTDCQWDPCYVEPYAACCLGAGSCEDTTQQECFDWGGEWGGSGTDCSSYSCGEAGACCYEGYDCSEDYEDDCNWNGGSFQGEGTSCDDYPCGSPYGACCFSPGDCYETDEHKCYDAGGDFWQDAFCEDVCYAVTPEGACCIDGDCSIWEEQDCDNIEGTYFGDGSECAGIECPPPPPMNMGYSVVGTNFVSGVGFNWTLDLYVTLPDGWRVDAVAGNSDQNKTLVCTGGFYQNPNGGPLSSDLNPNNYQFDSNLEWDSRVTIGALDMSGNPFGSNSVASIGIDWTDFESGLGLDVSNGTWYILPTEDQGNAQPFTNNDCQVRYGVLVARVTALGADSTVSMEGLVVAREDGQSNSQQLEISATEIPWVETTDCNANGINDACDIANGSSDDADGNGVPDECEQGDCVGDYNGDGQTNIDDILHVISGWGNPYDIEDLLGRFLMITDVVSDQASCSLVLISQAGLP